MLVYDVALANVQEFFSSRIRELCGQFNLSFFLVEPLWVYDFLAKLQDGQSGVRVLIDVSSDAHEPENPYYLLAKEVKSSGGLVIDDPGLVGIMAHKGIFHTMLVQKGIPVPETVIVYRSQLENFRLTDEIKDFIGAPFVVKPAWGGGRLGVIVDACSEEDLHSSAAAAPYSDSLLIQRKIVPKTLDGHMGWFRVFNVFGEIIPCWWEPPADQYQLVTPLQERSHNLWPLRGIVRDIAAISKMKFFSTEIALTNDDKFVAVDYLNNNCDMRPKSLSPTGVPDEVVSHIAWLLVSHAMVEGVLHKKSSG